MAERASVAVIHGRPHCLRLVLGMIATEGPMRVRDVTERMTFNAGHTVTRLADLGFVVRIAGKDKMWEATARGVKRWRRYMAEVAIST